MRSFLATIRTIGAGDLAIVTPVAPVDPGFGGGWHPVDPGYGHGDWSPVDPGYGHGGGPHPGHALPVPPVRPANPIVLPPGVWPPQIPGIDNSLPGVPPDRPIFVPPDSDIGIEQPIYLPQLPAGSALLIALPPTATPKAGVPAGVAPALLWKGAGTKPVLVYVTAAPTATPK
jgi:hypothetical protein